MNNSAVTEARYHCNGGNAYEALPYAWRQLKYLAELKPCIKPPEIWHQNACADLISDLALSDESSRVARRSAYVEHAYQRYGRYVLIDRAFIAKTVKQADEQVAALLKEVPQGIFQNNAINQRVLKANLPAQVLHSWPKINAGFSKTELATDSESLKLVDCDLAKTFIELKKAKKAQNLKHLKVNSLGRHRFWANPFGTVTGRDKPEGFNLMYLPAQFREKLVIAPPDTVLVLLDYEQQELLVAAALAGDEALLSLYKQGDIYSEFNDGITERKKAKKLVLGYLYGQRHEDCGLSESRLQLQFTDQFSVIDDYLDYRVGKALAEGSISCRDWQMKVQPFHNPLSLRNWPIQATAADILREASFQLDITGIPTVAAFHDALLIQCPLSNPTPTIQAAIRLMTKASEIVLKNAALRVSIAATYYPRGI